jgi:hypothetical protein
MHNHSHRRSTTFNDDICNTTNVIEVNLVNSDRKTRKKFEFELDKGFISVTRHARFASRV